VSLAVQVPACHFLPSCPEEVRIVAERQRIKRMRFEESDIETLMERLEKIESQNRRLKVGGIVAVVIILAGNVASLGSQPHAPNQINSAAIQANSVTGCRPALERTQNVLMQLSTFASKPLSSLPNILVELLFSFRGVSQVEVPADRIHASK
jgi:hypothetical protein